MQIKAVFATALLCAVINASPIISDNNQIAARSPASNVPITDKEMAELKKDGAKVRSEPTVTVRSPKKNEPITDAEYKALQAAGLKVRAEEYHELITRDSVMNCGHLVSGKGGSNGHGKWVPVQAFANLANEFCNAYVGTDISKGHETSDTYSVTLSSGKTGTVVFAIYNLYMNGKYTVSHDQCLSAMQAPLGSHQKNPAKRSVIDGVEYFQIDKRDNCWGHKNNDYEGGYYKINTIGAFGSEVYQN